MNFNTIGSTLLVLLCIQPLLAHELPIYCKDNFIDNTATTCLAIEYAALRDLYLATDGDNWTNRTNWLTQNEFLQNPTPPDGINLSDWYGVTLHENGCVQSLNLGLNNLTGTIPVSIGDFTELQILSLRQNTISGNIPAEIGNLTLLENFWLDYNLLTGEIPSTIGNLALLETLDFDFNALTGSIPISIGNLTNLIHLAFDSNQLTGPIPSSMGSLENLKYLYLKYNSIGGPIPASLGNLTQLIILSIHDNQLTGTIPESLAQLSVLQNLMLDDNLLTGSIPNELGSMNSLIKLRLSGNQLTGTIPSSFSNLTNLNLLTFQNNQLSGCFDENLVELCIQLNIQNSLTTDGNHFCIPWEVFCATSEGACDENNQDDYCFCETALQLHENPESDLLNRASVLIHSDDVIRDELSYEYYAGNHIKLNPGFEVQIGSALLADIENCEEDCVVSEPCEGSPCAEVDFELDSEGSKYVPNQLTCVFPGGSAGSTQDDVKPYLDSIFFNGGFILNSMNLDYATFIEGTSIEKCLCNHDIYLYTIDPIYIIDEEGGGVAANSNGGPMSEGPSYSLNHFIDAGLLNEDAPDVVVGMPTFSDMTLNQNSSGPVVAFLDSGINPETVPHSSLLGLSLKSNVLVNIGCEDEVPYDTFGWSFVDGTEDVTDRRGHGTAVYLSYLNALEKIGLNVEDQSSLIVKVLNDCGQGTAFDAACGIQYAAERGADVINMSWGLYTNNLLLQEVIDEVGSNSGVLFSCSSGNAGQNLANKDHFPSGYGYPFMQVIDPTTGETQENTFLEVFEVGGLCRAIAEPSCLGANEDVSFWSSANYRAGEILFAEAAIEIQDIVDPNIMCGIMGTSYAAPQFTAGLVNELIEVGIGNVDQEHMLSNSVSWTDNATNFSYNSYILANDQQCN